MSASGRPIVLDSSDEEEYQIARAMAASLQLHQQGHASAPSPLRNTVQAAIAENTPVTVQNVLLGSRVRPGPHFADAHSADEYGGGDGADALGVVVAVVDGQTAASAGKKYARVRWLSSSNAAAAGAAPAVAATTTHLYRLGGEFCDLAFAEAIVPKSLVGAPVDAGSAVMGARVSRMPGLEWSWGNAQDQQLVAVGGAVICGADRESGWVRVRFAGGRKVQVYRGGADGVYDLCYGCVGGGDGASDGNGAVEAAAETTSSSAAATTTTIKKQPPQGGAVVTPHNFHRGARVLANRGAGGDWRWGSQDRDNGTVGELLSLDRELWARVRWCGTGLKHAYRVGADSAYDLRYDSDPLAPPTTIANGAPAAVSWPTSAGAPAASKPSNAADQPPNLQQRLCAEFPALEPVVIESVLYQIRDETKARAILLEMAASAAAAATATVTVPAEKGPAAAPNIDDILGNAPGAQPQPPADPEYGEKPQLVLQVKSSRSAADVKDDEACLLCLTEQKVYACVPCGHLIACVGCREAFERNSKGTCLICRARFSMLLKIYM